MLLTFIIEILYLKFFKCKKNMWMHQLGCNILYAINDYGRVAHDACEAGAKYNNYWCWNTYKYARIHKNFPDVALIPIVQVQEL